MLSSLTGNVAYARHSLAQVLNFALVLSTAFMLWKGLSIATNSSSPIVVVLSGSMEPAFQRGDLLFLWNRGERAEVGEIVVYNVKGKDIPIVHRVVRSFTEEDPKLKTKKTGSKPKAITTTPSQKLLTKGDNNPADDTELYSRGQDHLDRKEDVVGSVRGYIPGVGDNTPHETFFTTKPSDPGSCACSQTRKMGSVKRIGKEFAELTESPPTGITIELVDESDLYKWKVYMEGPEGTPYQVFTNPCGNQNQHKELANCPQGGRFLVNLILPNEYPFKPPTVSFATKIYHPNVSNDDKGSMCLGMLKSDEWKPSSRIGAVLEFARQLLVEPMPDDAVEGRIAEQYQNDRKRFDEVARDWTRRYAREEEEKQ
ncbi:signal peptidase, endoplasmic reticulum-type [Talaromyces islandicus]|uniref:Signal peptidase complex catalytic subunit SEC11 n=1 Tax=Talaromyces islandicus TaxID=28573 RepID=A0A0U1MB75_TALIS|nr:signal peptidase, endoplasmic reticulum-type [Talaromyces islandicus]